MLKQERREEGYVPFSNVEGPMLDVNMSFPDEALKVGSWLRHREALNNALDVPDSLPENWMLARQELEEFVMEPLEGLVRRYPPDAPPPEMLRVEDAARLARAAEVAAFWAGELQGYRETAKFPDVHWDVSPRPTAYSNARSLLSNSGLAT